MLERLFAPKAAKIQKHPEWLPANEINTHADNLPEKIAELSGEEFSKPGNDQSKFQAKPEKIQLPAIEIPEHLPNWFDVMSEVIDELNEETALGNMAAIGKMGAHDPRIIQEYTEKIPSETLKNIQEHCISIACEQAKKLNAHIMGREILEAKDLYSEQMLLKKLFYIARTLTVGGHDDLARTLIQLESSYNRAVESVQ